MDLPAPVAPAPVLNGPGRAFRASLRLFAHPAAWWSPPLGAALGAALLLLSSLVGGVRVPASALAGVAAVIWALSGLGVAATLLLYIAFCPVRVGVDGVAGFTFWGLPLLLRWEEIADARRRSLLGFPYLVVASARQRRSLWIALPLADPDGFAAAVAEHGGPEGPVGVALAAGRKGTR